MDYEVGEVVEKDGKRYIVAGYGTGVDFDGEPEEWRVYRLIEEDTGEETFMNGEKRLMRGEELK
jgi:hypothetical protein